MAAAKRASKHPELDALKQEVEALKTDIKRHQESRKTALASLSEGKHQPVLLDRIKIRRRLKGHFDKIYAMHWLPNQDRNILVSASQDSKLIVWNAFTTNKLACIPLVSAWVMTCAFSPSGKYIASGGLDNVCSVYDFENKQNEKPVHELRGHEGYVSCVRFVTDQQMVSSSGDSTCILWDVNTQKCVNSFADHTSDCMTLDVNPRESNLIVSGCIASGGSGTARIWDTRLQKNACVATFRGSEGDVNTVKWMPDGNAFVAGSDDGCIRLWDIRAYAQLGHYADASIRNSSFTSVDVSASGRFIFGGADDYSAHAFDTLTGSTAAHLQPAHDNRVSCLGVAPDGRSLCTGSWDTLLHIWA